MRNFLSIFFLCLFCCATFVGTANAKLFLSLYATGGEYSFATEQEIGFNSLTGFKLSLDFEGGKTANDFSLEGTYNQVTAENLVDGSPLDATIARLDVIYPLIQKTKWRPFLTVGIGRILFTGNDTRPLDEDIVAYGAGLKYLLTEYLTLRAEGRHELLFNREEGNIDNYEYTASIGYTFGKRKPRKKQPKPKEEPKPEKPPEPKISDDDDLDGVKNPDDRCPGTPVGIEVDSSGCVKHSPGYVLPSLPTVIAITALESLAIQETPLELEPVTIPPTVASAETPVSADAADLTASVVQESSALPAIQKLPEPLPVPTTVSVSAQPSAAEATAQSLAAASTGPAAQPESNVVPISIPECSGLPPHAILMLGKTDSGLLHVPVDEVQSEPQPFRADISVAKKTHVPSASFEFDAWRLTPQAQQVLSLLVQQLQGSKFDFTIRVEGHTDSKGSDAYNYNLSLLRANAVATFLVEEKGVDPAKVSTAGCGEWKPLASNETDNGRQLNRRFELVIMPADEARQTTILRDN